MKIKMLVVGGLVVGVWCLSAHAAESDWEQNPLDHGQPITASVDFTVKGGFVRALNGINGGPSAMTPRTQQMKDFEPLNVPSVRLHDIPLANGDCRARRTGWCRPATSTCARPRRTSVP